MALPASARLPFASLVLAASIAGADSGASSEFNAGLAALQATLDSGEPQLVLSQGRRLLRELDDDASVDAGRRAELYDLMFEGARRARELRSGNAFAADLQKGDRHRYGELAVERVPGLRVAARWFAWGDQFESEQQALTESIRLLERAYGPKSVRLVESLRDIASACVRSRRQADTARAALDRALQLEYRDTPEDVRARAEVFAVRGDVEALFAEPAAGSSWYRAAWQWLADSKLHGPEAANATFAQPKPIYVHVPDAPFRSRRSRYEHFETGVVSFAFTVSSLGTIEQLRVRQSPLPLESLPDPVTRAFREARYRPRLIGGQPVATPDHGFDLRFSRDTGGAQRKAQFGQVDRS